MRHRKLAMKAFRRTRFCEAFFNFLNFHSTGVPCLCFNWWRLNYEVFLVPRKHTFRSDNPKVQLVVLHRLQVQQVTLRFKLASIEKLSTDEVTGVLQCKLQEACQQYGWRNWQRDWRWSLEKFCRRTMKSTTLIFHVKAISLCSLSHKSHQTFSTVRAKIVKNCYIRVLI